jgi:hypothetical protein
MAAVAPVLRNFLLEMFDAIIKSKSLVRNIENNAVANVVNNHAA